jgi:hypothetical protein
MNETTRNTQAAVGSSMHLPKVLEKSLTTIAKANLLIDTLEPRHCHELDFHEVSIWSLKGALIEAYLAGITAVDQSRRFCGGQHGLPIKIIENTRDFLVFDIELVPNWGVIIITRKTLGPKKKRTAMKSANSPEQQNALNEIFTSIAKENLRIDTLETRNSDSLDFHEVSVGSLKKALLEAYLVGMDAA